MLIASIRTSGLAQWRIAQLANVSESRLSRIVRRGVATDAERDTLSRLLGIEQAVLFAAGPAVTLNRPGGSHPAPGLVEVA
jgi:hypothetical protein